MRKPAGVEHYCLIATNDAKGCRIVRGIDDETGQTKIAASIILYVGQHRMIGAGMMMRWQPAIMETINGTRNQKENPDAIEPASDHDVTVRPDGWPQATTVGYVSDGLDLCFLCGLESQKARNLAQDDRVSLTIDHDTSNLMAAESHAEAEKVLVMMPLRRQPCHWLNCAAQTLFWLKLLCGTVQAKLATGTRGHGRYSCQ